MYIFGPYLFGIIFFIGFALHSLGLAKSVNPLSKDTSIYIILSLSVHFASVIYFCIFYSKSRAPKNNVLLSVDWLWKFYYFCTVLLLFEHVQFFLEYGAIPVFSENPEVLRFEFGKNGFIHIFAAFSTGVAAIIFYGAVFEKNNHISVRRALAAVLLSVILVGLVGHRGSIVSAFVPCIIAAAIRNKYKGVLFPVLIGCFVIFAMGAIKLYRDVSYYGVDVLNTIEMDWYLGGGIAAPLYFSYLGFVMNFNILDWYVNSDFDYGLGYYTAFRPILSPLPWFKSGLMDFQKNVLGVDFHGLLTPTFLGAPFIDFGFFGVIVVFVFSFIISKIYIYALMSARADYCLLYGFLSWQLILGVYTYTFAELYPFIYSALYFFLGKCVIKNK